MSEGGDGGAEKRREGKRVLGKGRRCKGGGAGGHLRRSWSRRPRRAAAATPQKV